MSISSYEGSNTLLAERFYAASGFSMSAKVLKQKMNRPSRTHRKSRKKWLADFCVACVTCVAHAKVTLLLEEASIAPG